MGSWAPSRCPGAGGGVVRRGRRADLCRHPVAVVQVLVELIAFFVASSTTAGPRSSGRSLVARHRGGELKPARGLGGCVDASTRVEAENARCSGCPAGRSARGPVGGQGRLVAGLLTAPGRRGVRRARVVALSCRAPLRAWPSAQVPGAPRAARAAGVGKVAFAGVGGRDGAAILDVGALLVASGSGGPGPPGAARDRRRDGHALHPLLRRAGEGARRRRLRRQRRLGRLGPALRLLVDLVVRPRVGRLLRGDLQRHQQAAAGVQPGRTAGRDDRTSSTSPERARKWSGSGRCTQARFGIDPGQRRPGDREFTGAEIRSCCRLAALLDIPLVEAAQNIVPVAVTAGESVERLRNWAAGRCLSADRPGLYTRASDVAARPGRGVHRGDPSAN